MNYFIIMQSNLNLELCHFLWHIEILVKQSWTRQTLSYPMEITIKWMEQKSLQQCDALKHGGVPTNATQHMDSYLMSMWITCDSRTYGTKHDTNWKRWNNKSAIHPIKSEYQIDKVHVHLHVNTHASSPPPPLPTTVGTHAAQEACRHRCGKRNYSSPVLWWRWPVVCWPVWWLRCQALPEEMLPP